MVKRNMPSRIVIDSCQEIALLAKKTQNVPRKMKMCQEKPKCVKKNQNVPRKTKMCQEK